MEDNELMSSHGYDDDDDDYAGERVLRRSIHGGPPGGCLPASWLLDKDSTAVLRCSSNNGAAEEGRPTGEGGKPHRM